MSPDHHNISSWKHSRSVSYLIKKSLRVVCPSDAGELDKTNFLGKSLDMMVLVNSRCQRIASAADIDRAKIATLISVGSTMMIYTEKWKGHLPTEKYRMQSIHLSEKKQKWRSLQSHPWTANWAREKHGFHPWIMS